MKKLFLLLAIATLIAVGAFAAADMYVNVETLNVRKGPGADFDLIGTLKQGTRVQVLDTSGSWYRIKSGNIEGYVNSSYLSGGSSGGSSDVKNYISGEVHFVGGGFRYERMLTDKMSIGANAYYDTNWLWWSEAGADACFRYYVAPIFFVGGGVGFHYRNSAWWSSYWGDLYGIAVTPDVGLKIDFGDKGGFFIQPGIKVPITFGWVNNNYYYYYYLSNSFQFAWSVVPYFGLGFAF